ncbi:MAG TPA: class I SAM-dependent methyltransferase, partial [Rhodocyclaceae bacterium]|nr:class I SAM-dependent methyltransferase [Rhodocyclaceae bacterium]
KPGDTVLDLGCGPANQLVQIARLNPAANFIGIDASQKMLDLAHDNVIRCGVSNVAFQQGHMERLGQFSDVSIDGVISTMSLHHLPDMAALRATCYEVRRILKPDGALYFADFGRLKRMATQRFFAEDRKSTQPAIFTVDYFNSLRAAFSLRDLTEASHVLGDRVKIHKTFLVPFLVVAKTGQRHTLEIEKRAAARSMYAALTPRQKYDLRDLSRFFRHGGLPLPFKPWQTTLHAIEPALQ